MHISYVSYVIVTSF